MSTTILEFKFWTPEKRRQSYTFFFSSIIVTFVARGFGFAVAMNFGIIGQILSWLSWILVISGMVISFEQVFNQLFRKNERIEVEGQFLRYFKSGKKPTIQASFQDIEKLTKIRCEDRDERYLVRLKGPKFLSFDSMTERAPELATLLSEESGKSYTIRDISSRVRTLSNNH